MEPVFSKQLTEEQKKAVKALHRKYSLRNAWIGSKAGLTIVGFNYIVAMLDLLYVHSKGFLVIGGIVTAIIFLRQMQDNLNKNTQEFIEEVKKVANS